MSQLSRFGFNDTLFGLFFIGLVNRFIPWRLQIAYMVEGLGVCDFNKGCKILKISNRLLPRHGLESLFVQ